MQTWRSGFRCTSVLSNGMHPKTTVSLEKIVHDSGCPTRTLPNYDRKQRRNLAILLRRIRKMTKIHQKTPKSTIFDAPTSKASTHDSGEDLPYFCAHVQHPIDQFHHKFGALCGFVSDLNTPPAGNVAIPIFTKMICTIFIKDTGTLVSRMAQSWIPDPLE